VKRREFLVFAGSAIVAWPGAGRAQSGKVTRIGLLVLGNPDPGQFLTELRAGLRLLGHVEGESIQFEFRSADGNQNRLPALAAELVGLKVDIIVAFQTPTVIAAKKATNDIPIVMCPAGDPVATGLVASLSRPGGNVTGVSGATAELGGKNLELIREVLPSARRVAALANAPDPFHRPFLQYVEKAASTLDFEFKAVLLQRPETIEASFLEVAKWRAEAVIVQPSLPLGRAANLAIQHRLPAISPTAPFPAAGGLMSYSADTGALIREGAVIVDKILKGRKPADLPVQQPTKFLMNFNLKTAKAIGLTVPPTLLARADNVIE
jgi:putative ABC transport system substrate-binding protein